MKTLTVRGVELGAGRPKLIAPLTGGTRAALLAEAAALRSKPAQLAEWRADLYEDALDETAALETARRLRAVLGDLPLLFTLRTKREGGALDAEPERRAALNLALARSGCADLIDVELSIGEPRLRELIDGVHAAGCLVVGSRHEFQATPDTADMVAWLREAQALGVDIPKLAVMPRGRADVLALLAASVEMRERYADRPFLTISMGPLGVLSRVACEFSGSCMTFGAAGAASAPGQIPVEALEPLLDRLHEAMEGGA